MAEPVKMVIDCDVGTDDSQAILMALSQPHIQVVAITTVFGNAPVVNTSWNALRVLKAAGRLDIPVFVGCESSLIGHPCRGDGFHGVDGLGDFTEADPPSRDLLQKEHSANALVRITKEHPGQLTLVATGPLTNIAVALRLDPDFGKRLKDCYVMGGAYLGRGNIRPSSEFNFWSDPEAAYVTFNQLGTMVTVIPLETCADASVPWDWYEQLISIGTPLADFIGKSDEAMVLTMKGRNASTYFAMWDQLAMSVAIDNKVAIETVEHYTTVELHGEMTRGQVVVDWRNQLGKDANVRFVTKVNHKLFRKLMWAGAAGK